ncbi:hypothetical protein M8818_005057 [Zalaria obscura]|uniref:Uncharacterized protein n=1 Tax=Zalaria obscura TaxID=2024903 RepID=A0ACC3SAG9_9PEZI
MGEDASRSRKTRQPWRRFRTKWTCRLAPSGLCKTSTSGSNRRSGGQYLVLCLWCIRDAVSAMIASRPDHFDLYTPHLHCHHVSFLPARSNQPPAFGASYLNVCIPANEENEDYEQLRDLSISRMHDIYANASAVLILDPDLWCLPGSATATEIMIKFVISAHAARLWTYQETTLCSRVYALGKDCIHDLRGLSSQLDREALVGCISNFALGAHQRLFGLGETTTARELDPNQIFASVSPR